MLLYISDGALCFLRVGSITYCHWLEDKLAARMTVPRWARPDVVLSIFINL